MIDAELLAPLLTIYDRCRLDRPIFSALHTREYLFCSLQTRDADLLSSQDKQTC